MTDTRAPIRSTQRQWMTYWFAMHRDAYTVPIVVGPVWADSEASARHEAGNFLQGREMFYDRTEPYKRPRKKAVKP